MATIDPNTLQRFQKTLRTLFYCASFSTSVNEGLMPHQVKMIASEFSPEEEKDVNEALQWAVDGGGPLADIVPAAGVSDEDWRDFCRSVKRQLDAMASD